METNEQMVVDLIVTNQRMAALIAELTGWLQDGFTHGADLAAVAGIIRQMRSRLVTNQRTIRDLLWRERLEKARVP